MNYSWPFCRLIIAGTVIQFMEISLRDAGPQHEGDGKFRRPHRSSGLIYVDGGFFRLFYVDDDIFHHPYVVGLRHAWLL
jgi:hypothetical protein